jgi:hypothetical protein
MRSRAKQGNRKRRCRVYQRIFLEDGASKLKIARNKYGTPYTLGVPTPPPNPFTIRFASRAAEQFKKIYDECNAAMNKKQADRMAARRASCTPEPQPSH